MHLLLLDANAGVGTGHSLSYASMLAEAAHALGWELTVVAPHPPTRVPMHFEPVAPSYVPSRGALRNRLAQRAAVRRADHVARVVGADLIIDAYLHPKLGLHRFSDASPPRVRVLHHAARLRRRRARRPWRNWQQASIADLRALVDSGDVLAVLADAGAASLRSLVPDARVVTVTNPMRLDAPRSLHTPGAPPTVAFVGEPRPDKGWPELVAALPHVTEPMRVLAITSAPVDLPAIPGGTVTVEQAADVRDHAAFQHAVAAADAAAVVHTPAFGQRDASSGTLLEVLAAGLPAVCGEILAPSLPDDPVAYRVVDPADARALATALDALVRDLTVARAAAAVSGPAEIARRHDPQLALREMLAAAGLPDPAEQV